MFNSAEAVTGAKLALWSLNGVTKVEVMRVTQNMIITTEGGRYNREDGTQIRGNAQCRHRLGSLEDQDVKVQLGRQIRRSINRRLITASEALLNSPTQENLKAVKDLTALVEAHM